jgi:pantoate--beta-alanine ligase
MEIFNEIAPLRAFLKENRRAGKTIGLVPTMGALHRGHVALIESSNSANTITVCTIYVNPTQFNNPGDLLKYPRDFKRDVELLEKVGCDVVFYPSDNEMYEAVSLIKFDFGHLNAVMEGKFRPGHFSGVALVVSKLFNIVAPDNAYFGQKDWQQFAIIQQVAQELKFDLELHAVPTFRETDGLAMSSRNLRLNDEERPHATVFYRAMVQAKELFATGKEIAFVKQIVDQMVNNEAHTRLEYFEVANSKNLNVLEFVNGAEMPIMCIAGYVGDVRLIDNMFVK